MAIAEGSVCRFTRVVGGGLEAMASELAERHGVAVADARASIATAELPAQPAPAQESPVAPPVSPDEDVTAVVDAPSPEPSPELDVDTDGLSADTDLRIVLENGIREIAGEVRNSLEFHRSQEGGGEVTLVVLSGAALDVPGFADILESELGVAVTRETVGMADGALDGADDVSPQRLAIATGLAIEEAPR